MNEVILTLILAGPTGLVTTEAPVESPAACIEQGESRLGTWIESGNTRYLVTGYICKGESGVTAAHQ